MTNLQPGKPFPFVFRCILTLFFIPVIVLLAIAAPRARAQAASASHAQVEEFVDRSAANWKQISKQIWDYAELGYHENKSSALLQAQLKAAGFSVQAGVAGEPRGLLPATVRASR